MCKGPEKHSYLPSLNAYRYEINSPVALVFLVFTDKLCKRLWTMFDVDARSGVHFCSLQFEIVKQAHCHISSTDVLAETKMRHISETKNRKVHKQ